MNIRSFNAPKSGTEMAALAKKYGVRDVLKTYIYSRQYTKEELLPCAAHIVDGKITDTMFDSFIFLPSPCYLYDTSDPELQAEGCHKRMTKADWLSYLTDLQNVPGHNVEALDAAVGETKAALGLTDYKANIFPSILYPTKGTADKFGEVYGKKLDLRDPADRLASIKWMVDEQIRQFESHHYQNLRLAGFYWFTEYVDIEADAAMLREFTDYVRSLGYITIWSAFYRAGGFNRWQECHFDLTSMQTNYFPSEPQLPNAGGVERLKENAELTDSLGMGVELEADNPAKERGITAFKEYMKAGLDYGYADGYHVYYIGGGPSELCTIYNHQDPYFQSMYHDLYKFLKGKLKASEMELRL